MSDLKSRDAALFEWHLFEDYRDVLEALIFGADAPLSSEKIAEAMQDKIAEPQVREMVELLNRQYQDSGHAFEIVHVAGGYRFRTRSAYSPYLRRLLKARIRQKLSYPALETLSVTAYKQPVTKAEIEALRGVNVDGSLRTLLSRDLIRISGRARAPGRPLLYATTDHFLTYFGINNVSDLPQLREIEALLPEEKEEQESEA
jgi:segregation and condensation protein B